MKIFLNDILNIKNLENVKIRLNTKSNKIKPNAEHYNYDPVKHFKEKDLDELQNDLLWNYNKHNFRKGQTVIGFIQFTDDLWLLYNIVEITEDLNNLKGVGYKGRTLNKYEKYFGRLVIKYHNNAQNMVRNASTLIDKCELHAICPENSLKNAL
jgi:hypothetical protein